MTRHPDVFRECAWENACRRQPRCHSDVRCRGTGETKTTRYLLVADGFREGMMGTEGSNGAAMCNNLGDKGGVLVLELKQTNGVSGTCVWEEALLMQKRTLNVGEESGRQCWFFETNAAVTKQQLSLHCQRAHFDYKF